MNQLLSILLNAKILHNPLYNIYTDLSAEWFGLTRNELTFDILITKGDYPLCYFLFSDVDNASYCTDYSTSGPLGYYCSKEQVVNNISDAKLDDIPYMIFSANECIVAENVLSFLDYVIMANVTSVKCDISSSPVSDFFSETSNRQAPYNPTWETSLLKQQKLIANNGRTSMYGKEMGFYQCYYYDLTQDIFISRYYIYNKYVRNILQLSHFINSPKVKLEDRIYDICLCSRNFEHLPLIINALLKIPLIDMWGEDLPNCYELNEFLTNNCGHSVESYGEATALIQKLLVTKAPNEALQQAFSLLIPTFFNSYD